MKICGIYKITSITGCIYIGQSVNIHWRWREHKRYFGSGSPRLHNSFKKHGIENHTFEILEECPRELLNEREIHWIKHFDSFDTPHGMNLVNGGFGSRPSLETRKRQGEAQKKKAPPTEEARKNMSKSQMGNKYRLGTKHPEEVKKNISKKLRGNKYSLGIKQSPETIAKREKTRKENKELKQHKIQSILFRQYYFSSFLHLQDSSRIKDL